MELTSPVIGAGDGGQKPARDRDTGSGKPPRTPGTRAGSEAGRCSRPRAPHPPARYPPARPRDSGLPGTEDAAVELRAQADGRAEDLDEPPMAVAALLHHAAHLVRGREALQGMRHGGVDPMNPGQARGERSEEHT